MKTKKSILFQSAIVAGGNSLKRFALISISIILFSSTLSATNYCSTAIGTGLYATTLTATQTGANQTTLVLGSGVDALTANFNIQGTAFTSNTYTTTPYGVIINWPGAPPASFNIYFHYSTVASAANYSEFLISAVNGQNVCVIAGIPTIAATSAASSITTTTATSGGNVTAIGNSAVTARGVCWGTATSPTVALATKTSDGSGIGTFTSSITGLSSGVKYYVRSYATNTQGTAYGAEVSFSTTSALPTLAATTAASAITTTTATSGGNVTAIGTSAVTAKGVCWATTTAPTVVLATKTSDGSGTGSFTSSLTSLTAGTTYYVRAYATNTTGTAYGAEVSFATTAPEITSAPTPTRLAANVISIFSDAYTNLAGTNFAPGWGQSTVVTDNPIGGNAMKKYTNFNYIGIALAGPPYPSPSVSGMTMLHVDVYPTTSQTIRLTPIHSPSGETPTSLGTLIPNQWNSFDIALSVYTGVIMTDIFQFKFDGGAGGTFYMDNLYFYKPVTAPGAPTAAVATRGNASASVAFTAPASNGGSAITGYTVTSSPGGLTATGASSPLNVTGLTNGTPYTFTVTATNAVGTSAASTASTAVTPATVPGAPTAAVATRGNVSASVAFTAPASTGGSAITGYTVTSSPGSFTATGASSPLNVTGLTNGTSYTFTVTATNAVGTGAASTASTAVTPATIPGAPTIGTITPTDGTLSIAFTAGTTGGSAITNYKYSTNGGGLFTACSPPQTNSPIVITGLSNGTLYNIQIRAVNAIGDGTATVSTAATPSIAAIAPSAPTITVITPTSGQLSVAFTAGSNGGSAITNYKYSTDGGSNFTACSPTQTTSPVVITGLSNGTPYNIQLKAVNAVGDGTATASTAATPASVPGAPTIGTATAGNAQVSITFSAPGSNGGSAVTGYTVTSSPGDFATSGASSPLVVTGLTNGTAYTFTVTATNIIGTGTASSSTGSVTPATTPSAPTITGITPSNGQLSVAFTAGTTGGSAITNYKYSTNGGSSFTACSPEQTASPVVITGLSNGTSYNVQLKAVNAIGDGTATASSNATTPTTPDAPTIGTITLGNGQLSVAFTAGSTGGSALTNYKYSTDGGSSFTACSPAQTSSPVVITGLTNNTTYNVQLKAVNEIGDGTATASTTATPFTVATTPTILAASVKSLYSDAYTPAATVTFGSWWNMTFDDYTFSAGQTAKKWMSGAALASGGVNFESTPIDISSMAYLHVDIYPTSTFDLGIKLVTVSHGETSGFLSLGTLTANQWNSKDVLLSAYGVSNLADLKQVGFSTPGSAGTFYMDNLYFYKAVPDAPTSIVATAGNAQASVAFTAPSVTGASAILDYTVTSSPGNITATAASSPIKVTGLSNAGTDYTFTVTARNTQGSGAASAASNPTVRPHAIDNIISVSALTNVQDMTLTPVSDLLISSNKLNVNQTTNLNSITVAPGAELSITAGTLTATNGITLQSSASGTATMLNSGTYTGTVIAEQYLGVARNWYVSSPVQAINSPANNITRYYEYVEAGDNDPLLQPTGSTAYWKGLNTGTSMTVCKGYIAQSSGETTVQFSGTPNNGNITTSFNLTRDDNKGKGFNLVGNPYPSYIDWSLVAGANTNLMSTAWFKTKKTDIAGAGYTFASVNVTTPSSPEIVSNSANTTITKYIPPTQAFWVRVKSGTATTTMSFTNAMREHRLTSGDFMKAPKANVRTRLRLQLANGNETDETLIYFDSNATNDFNDYDSPKMLNNSAKTPDLYSKAGAERVVINGLNAITDNLELPLGFSLNAAATLKLKATEMSNLPAGTRIYLRDKVESTQTELLPETEYSFSTTAPTTNNESRFSLLFRAPGASTGIDNANNFNAQVFVNAANQITIFAPEKANYSIYNAMGQQLENGRITSNSQTSNFKLAAGVYVVKVNNQTTRVIIK